MRGSAQDPLGPRPRGPLAPRALAIAALALGPAAVPVTAEQPAPAAAPPPAEDKVEVRWTQVYVSPPVELALNQEIDLDFNDRSASQIDMQFEPWEDGGLYWAPRRNATAALAGPGDFASFEPGKIDALNPSGNRIPLVQKGSPVVTPGTIIAVATNDGHYAKVSIDSVEATLKIHWVTYAKEVIRIAAAPSTLQAPRLKTPPNEIEFEHTPRELQLVWGTVSGAVSYTLELDCKGCCAPRYDVYCSEEEGGTAFQTKPGLTQPEFITTFIGKHPGRWRVRAVGKDGKPGPWSGWSTFAFIN